MTDREIALMTPIPSLAYLGDAVYEVMVRERLVRRGVRNPSVQSLEYVTAGSQSLKEPATPTVRPGEVSRVKTTFTPSPLPAGSSSYIFRFS